MHRLRWDGKSLKPLDHDIENERVIGAFGGKPAACVQVCDLDRLDWSDPKFLPALFKGPASRVTAAQIQASMQQMSSFGLGRYAEHARRALIAAGLPDGVRNFIGLRAASRTSFEQKGIDATVVHVAEKALRSLLPEPEIDVRCVVSRYTRTPHAFGLRTKESARLFVALDTSWRRSVMGESAVTVDSHFVMRLNIMLPGQGPRRSWSGQILAWAGEGEVKWAEVRQARFTRAHAQDPWSMQLR